MKNVPMSASYGTPLAIVIAAMLTAAPALAQDALPAPLVSRDVFFDVNSGVLVNEGDAPATLFTTVVAADGSDWMRLSFDEVQLSGSRAEGNASYLRITSLTDGGVQILDNVSVLQWQLTTAYFNGDAVQIELIAHPGTGENTLRMSKGVASEPVGTGRSICGTTDDRQLSYDNRSARVLPIGCTGWTISDCNQCMLTAGHCQGGLSVIQFNVPLSGPTGSIVNPPPEHQYAVDPASVQGNGGQGVGSDWAYYGVFPNSNTNLTPFEAYGVAHNLALPGPVTGNLRVTGYGTTSSPVSPTWNQVQKTHAGPYVSLNGTTLRYGMDTTGGNSGSPVISEITGNAIGIHTHGGCSSTGGSNAGTGANHAALQAALADPRGVCACPGPEFSFPGGLPSTIAPNGGGSIEVQIVPSSGGVTPVPGTGVLHVQMGGAFVPFPMTDSGSTFVGTFPATDCGENVRYYFSVSGSDGRTHTSPSGAPGSATHVALSGFGVDFYADIDFEDGTGWTVQNTSITGGAWQRGVPIGGGTRSDPATDFDGSGACFVTGNAAGDSDVDGGPTRVISPLFDLLNASDPYLSYARWHVTNDSANDRFAVEISNNAGTTWTQIESVGSQEGWQVMTWRIADFVTPSGAIRVRFSSTDNPNNSVAESGLDAFRIYDIDCVGCPSDVNGDGVSDILDLLDFLNVYGPCDGQPAPCGDGGLSADFNDDGIVDVLDLLDFLDVFSQGCD
jgi:hypothetical protein